MRLGNPTVLLSFWPHQATLGIEDMVEISGSTYPCHIDCVELESNTYLVKCSLE